MVKSKHQQQLNSITNKWMVYSVGIYIILVFNFLEPFGIQVQGFNWVYHLFLSSYGVISSLTAAAVLYVLLPKIRFKWSEASQKQIIIGLIGLVLLISLSNWLYSQLLHFTISGWRHMYVPIRGFMELMPQFLAIYVIWGLLCWANIFLFLRNKNWVPVQPEDQPMTLKSENQIDSFKVKSRQVVCLKTCDNYLEVYYLDESEALRNRMIRSSMKKMTEQLDGDHFYRCHQSYLVNLAYIKGLKKVKNSHFLEMAYIDFDVSISRKNLKQVKSYLLS